MLMIPLIFFSGFFQKRSKPKVQILEKKKIVEILHDVEKNCKKWNPETDIPFARYSDPACIPLKDMVHSTVENQNNFEKMNSVKKSSSTICFTSTKVGIINEGKNNKICSIVTTV